MLWDLTRLNYIRDPVDASVEVRVAEFGGWAPQ